MSAAIKPYFNRLSANTSEDGAMAVFDIVPIDNLDSSSAITDPSDSLSFVSEDFHLFDIPSNHTRGTNSAYFLKRKTESFVEYPVSMGIPMTYGSSSRVRFKTLADSITEAEPFLMIPSCGFGRMMDGRARTFEFWMNAEPYAKLVRAEGLPASIANLENNPGDYTVGAGSVSLVSGSEQYPSEYCNTLSLGTNTDITFSEQFGMSGGRRYKFSIMASSPTNTTLTVRLHVQGYSTYTHTFQIPASNTYSKYEYDLTVSETIPIMSTTLRFTTNYGVRISEPVLEDLSEVEESAVVKHLLMQLFVDNGETISLFVDAQYMYLQGFSQIDNVQINEWARPMYIVFTDTGTEIQMYINAEPVMSITKRNAEGGFAFDYEFSDDFGGQVILNDIGDWIFLFLSPVFKYIDLSTVSLYSPVFMPDIQKLHYTFSYGPSYNDVLLNTEYQKSFVADGSATNWSSSMLFPVTNSFNGGVANGLSTANGLSIVDYPFPQLLPEGGLLTENLPITTVNDIRYGPNNFVIPIDTEMHLRLLSLDTNISHLFIGVSPRNIINATICRIQSKTSRLSCDIVMEAMPTNPRTFNIYARLINSDGSIFSTWWQSTTPVPDRDFTLCLNLDALKDFPDISVAGMFSETDIVLAIIDQIPIRYISCASTAIVNANNINVDPAVESLGIGIVADINALGKANYTMYASTKELDIAAAGYWTASIPLTAFSRYVYDQPDIDFILYFDQLQSPQLVSALNKSVMSYYEIEESIKLDTDGEYSDAQDEFGSMPYGSIGVDVDTSVPTLGRFMNRNVETFVTLDSQIRWPYKDYSKLKIERATPSNFIDFGASPNSVVDTKWEIFDGYAIRIPSDININKYNLKIGVHVNTRSMNTKKPVLNRLEMYGVASGEYAANMVNVGTGQFIVIGEGQDINIKRPYSTHLTAEVTQSNYMHRENGFYPHYDFENNKPFPVHFYLTDGKLMSGISFYMYWKNETFRTTGSREDKIATIRHFLHNSSTGEDIPIFTDIGVRTSSNLAYAYQRGNIIDASYTYLPDGQRSPYTYDIDVYVDGVLDGPIEVGRWHMIHIDFTKPMISQLMLPPDSRVVKLSLLNDKCVVNYVTSHATALSPTNLYASRFGLTDYSIFDIPEEDAEVGLTITENATISILKGIDEVTAPNAFLTLRITF